MYRFGFNLISSSNKSIDLDASFKLLNKESLSINFEIVPAPLLILLNIEERYYSIKKSRLSYKNPIPTFKKYIQVTL